MSNSMSAFRVFDLAFFIPGAFVVVAGCAIRLSYFNVFGLTDAKAYTGLPVDYNGLILSFAFNGESVFLGLIAVIFTPENDCPA